MSVDDALALAGQVLADYEASGAGNASGLDLLWRDRLARALRELAAAVSIGHVTPVSGRPTAVRETRPGSRLCRVPNALARIVGGWAGLSPEPGAVVLSAGDADTVWQALADAGAWHGVYGDCAACIAAGLCAAAERHEVIAVQYAALRAHLSGDWR